MELPALAAAGGDSYPLEGASLLLTEGRSQGRIFAGRAKHDLALPGRETERPLLYGADFLTRAGGNFFGAGVTVIEDPFYGDADRRESRDAVFSGRFIRQVSPWAHLFTEGFAAVDGSLGGRVGANVRFLTGELTSAVYSFENGFPFVYPLYRPGETGIEVRGLYRPSEFSVLFGGVNYVTEDQILQRSNLRGSLSASLSFGSNRPSLNFSYSRDEIVYDALATGERSFLADRIAVSASKSSSAEYLSLILEHVTNTGGVQPDRSQALLIYRRVLGVGSFLDGSIVAQREQTADYGLTADAALERPLRGRLYYVLGLGAAYRSQTDRESGEGVARFGIARRLTGNGWFARLEARIPFSIGLSRSGVNSRAVALDIGTRFGWKELRSLRSLFAPLTAPSQFGSIQGVVTIEGRGKGGMAILVNGEPLAVTGDDGSYRIRGVPVGSVVVTLDIRQLDPRYSVIEGFSREVVVAPRETARVEFVIAPLSYLQGSLVVCREGKVAPVPGAKILVRGRDVAREVITSNIGGFQLDELPPGIYEIEVDPASVQTAISPEKLPKLRLDLTQDVLGYVIRIDCPP